MTNAGIMNASIFVSFTSFVLLSGASMETEIPIIPAIKEILLLGADFEFWYPSVSCLPQQAFLGGAFLMFLPYSLYVDSE